MINTFVLLSTLIFLFLSITFKKRSWLDLGFKLICTVMTLFGIFLLLVLNGYIVKG